MDNDGDIFIIDRKKLIITGGENVLPSEVENALAEHPLIDRCVVVGYDHQNMVNQLLQPLYFAKMNLITLKF